MLNLDPQRNLTMCMSFQNPDELPCTMSRIIKGLIDETFAFQKTVQEAAKHCKLSERLVQKLCEGN